MALECTKGKMGRIDRQGYVDYVKEDEIDAAISVPHAQRSTRRRSR